MNETAELMPLEEALGVRTIPQALARGARTNAGVTVVDRDLQAQELSYSELEERAHLAAAILRARGIRRGDRVCILSSTSIDLLVGLFGVWCAGAVPVLLALPRRMRDPAEYVAELERRVRHSDARLVLVADAFEALLPTGALPADVIGLGALSSDAASAVELDPDEDDPDSGDLDDLAMLQFSSGSTARSRAVALGHRQLLSNVAMIGSVFEVDPDRDVVMLWLPLFHDMGLVMLVGVVVFGIPLVLQAPEEFLGRPASWMEALSRFGATCTLAPNFAYALATRDMRANPRPLDLSPLRVAAVGAEPIDGRALGEFVEAAGRYGMRREAITPVFGLAEVTLGVCVTPAAEPMRELWVSRDELELSGRAVPVDPEDPGARRLVCCGRPLPGTEVRIVDGSDTPVPAGTVGEICARSPSVMQGYWGDPEASADALRGGWLHTGDLGFLDGEDVVVCGRIKDMIIVGGRNLYPEDYEQCAAQVAGVRRGNVIAFGLSEIERMVIVAETKAPAEEAERIAREAMRLASRRLSHAPEEVVLLPPGTLPKTSSGKVQRGTCRQRYLDGELPVLARAAR